MSEERAFLKAVRANPDDRTARLVYADWLDDRDDVRGELIRTEEELRTTPVHADRYWELKPRRRELLASVDRSWLKKMGYGDATYLPVFADVPSGWKERWRLLREYVERWYRIPVDDVGAPPADLPPSVNEWRVFMGDLLLRLPELDRGTGDGHHFADTGDRIDFYQQAGNRELFFVRAEDRHQDDPPVWTQFVRSAPSPAVPHVTTLGLLYLLLRDSRGDGEEPTSQAMTKAFARRLAVAFPPHSTFDGTRIYERPDVIAAWIPASGFAEDEPCFVVKARTRAARDGIDRDLWDVT